MFKNILLGVDGSAHALRAARLAGDLEVRTLLADLTLPQDARLRVVVAFDPVPSYLGEPNLQNAITARMQEAEAILKDALQAVGETPQETLTEVLEGSAAEAILKMADLYSHDLIVVGSRGRGQLANLLLGSQTNKIIQHARCPVLVVR